MSVWAQVEFRFEIFVRISSNNGPFEYLPWAGLHNERHHLVYKHSIVAPNLTLFGWNCNNLIDSVLLGMLQTSADDSEFFN